MNKKKISITIAILFLLVGLTYAFWPESQYNKVQRMGAEMFSGGRPDPDKMKAFREEADKLTPEQHNQLREQGREEWEKRREQHEATRAAEYFALPPDKRKEYLDKQIADMENRRKEWESRRSQSGQNQNQGGPGGPGGPGMGPGGPGGPGQAGGGRGPQNRTPESRSARRNQRMDNVSPSQRAQMTAFRQDMAKRRAELGLPAWGPPPGGRGPR